MCSPWSNADPLSLVEPTGGVASRSGRWRSIARVRFRMQEVWSGAIPTEFEYPEKMKCICIIAGGASK